MNAPSGRLLATLVGGWLTLILATFCLWFCAAVAGAQDVSVPPPRLQLLAPGERAPRGGYLIPEEDLVWFRQRIETLEFRLSLEARTAQERCDVQLELQRSMTRAAEDRLAVISEAHATDRAALLRRIEEEEAETLRVRRERDRWYRSPTLWFAVGVVSVGGFVLTLR